MSDWCGCLSCNIIGVAMLTTLDRQIAMTQQVTDWLAGLSNEEYTKIQTLAQSNTTVSRLPHHDCSCFKCTAALHRFWKSRQGGTN